MNENKKSNIKKILICVGGVTAVGVAYCLGRRSCVQHMIDICEETGKFQEVFGSSKTPLLYEITCECIGD